MNRSLLKNPLSPFSTLALSATPLILAAAFAAFSVWTVFAWYHPVPYQDSWGLSPIYRGYLNGTLDFDIFWRTHNEHRIPILKLLSLLDFAWARGTGYLLISMSLALQLAFVFVVARSLRGLEGTSLRERIFLTSAALFTSFWLVQSGNFAWSFQVAWFLNAFSAALAAYLVSGIPRTPQASGVWRILVASLACAVATYNVASGLFMAAILWAVLWKLRLPRGYLVYWTLFCLALAVSFFWNYHPVPGAEDATNPNTDPFGMLYYLLVYLGNPVSRFSLTVGAVLGATGLAFTLRFAWRFFRSPSISRFEVFALGQLAYVVITGAVTAVGRSGMGIEQATSSRYYTTVLSFWLFLFILVYNRYGRTGKSRVWVHAGAMALLVFIVLPIQALSVPQRQTRYVKADEGALALITGVQDSSALQYLCVSDSVTWAEGAFLKERKLSVYREDWPHWMGRSLSTYTLVRSEGDSEAALEADLEEVRPVGESPRAGLFVRGRLKGMTGVHSTLLFVRGDTVVGAAKTRGRDCDGCFTGYVRGEDKSFEIVSLDAVLPSPTRPSP